MVLTTDEQQLRSKGPQRAMLSAGSESDSGSDSGSESSTSTSREEDANDNDLHRADDDWYEDTALQTLCLFCEQTLPEPEALMAHLQSAHDFDYKGYCSQLGLDSDIGQRIAFVNWIRTQKPDVGSVKECSASEGKDKPWQMHVQSPALSEGILDKEDPLLSYDWQDWSDEEDQEDVVTMAKFGQDKSQMSREDLERLSQNQAGQIRTLTALLDESNISQPSKPRRKGAHHDHYYFDSYATTHIHREMIEDHVRTSSYAQAILHNTELFRGKVVIDVGCGSGILSLFAAKAGAARVYAIEASNIADLAQKNFEKNDPAQIIRLVRGKVEEIQIPEKADIIVSEWMGYALLYESMLDSVLKARDDYLKPDGLMFPTHCRMVLAAFENKSTQSFWRDVYGFDFSAMEDTVDTSEAEVEYLDSDCLISAPRTIFDLNLSTITAKDLDFHSQFELQIEPERKASGLALWFDTFFTHSRSDLHASQTVHVGAPLSIADVSRPAKATDCVSFTTGPQGIPTHWKQTLFHFQAPLSPDADNRQVIGGEFECRKSIRNHRELDVTLTVNGSRHIYRVR